MAKKKNSNGMWIVGDIYGEKLNPKQRKYAEELLKRYLNS